MPYRSSWCDVDLQRFRRNLSVLQDVARTKLLLVVKANAYGHGLVRIASEAVASGINMLGVATIGEAEDLINSDVRTPILIMCAMDEEEIDYCIVHGIHFFAWRSDHFLRAEAAAAKYGVDPKIHVEIDTGMSRSGVCVDDFSALLESLPAATRRNIVGLATHFHSADLENTDSAHNQLDEYLRCVKLAHEAGMKPLLHVANSPGTIRIPESRLGMVRMGIAAYGLPPSDDTVLPSGVSPVLTWKANVTNVKSIGPGQGVGYGWKYIAANDETVATLGVGYADGYRRYPEGINTVLIGAVEAPVVGSVFMDQCLVRVPQGVPCRVGDTAVLIGERGDSRITAEDLALRWATNNYDVVSGIRSRVPRRYLE